MPVFEEKRKEGRKKRQKEGKVEKLSHVPRSKTWVNLLVVELGQFDHSRSFLHVYIIRASIAFFNSLSRDTKNQVGSIPCVENTLAFLAFENDISDAVTSCNTVEKHCPYLFFQREKVNCSNNEDEKKDFFPPSSNIMKIVTNPT